MPAQGGRYPVGAHDRPLRWRLSIADDSGRQGFFQQQNAWPPCPRTSPMERGQTPAARGISTVRRRSSLPDQTGLTSARGTGFVAMLSRPQSAPGSKAEIEPTSRSMGTPPSPLCPPLLHQRQCEAVIALEADGLERGRVELRMVVKEVERSTRPLHIAVAR